MAKNKKNKSNPKTKEKQENKKQLEEVDEINEKDRILNEIKAEIEESRKQEAKTDKKKTEKPKAEDVEENDKEAEEESKEESKEETKKDSEKEQTAIVPVVGKEQKKEKKKKSKKKAGIILTIIVIIAILVGLLSTIFAILQGKKDTIAKGVLIKNIDMSNLTKEEATKKLIDNLVKELNVNINLKYEDLIEECSSEDITFRYDVPKAIEEAYSLGRNDNLLIANFDVVKSYLKGNNVQIEYSYDKDKAESKIKSLQSKITNSVVEPAYEIDGATLVVSKGKDGLAINIDQVKDEIINNIIGRNYNEIKESQEPYTITVNTYQKQADKIDMQKIGEAIYTEPVNAIYVKEPFSLTKEKNGVKLAISAEEAQAQVDGQDKQEYSFPLTITKPEITINDIGLEAFPYKISTFSTNYDASNVSRTNNLKIASNKTNNVVIMPGEVFSFNQVVGKRTVEEGYKDAKVYENGKVVDGLAGGICQVSSTMYDAALLANLEIVERYNHQFTTSYLPGGKDATVVYGIKDFKFRNSRKYPIKIVTSMGGGTITYSIYGIQEENEYTVVITPVITSRIAGRTITEVDKSLAPGKSVTVQAGHSGQRVTTYKELWQNGTKISSEVITNDVYNAMDTIVHVGPAAPAPAPAPAIPTPAPTTPQQTPQNQQQNKTN